MRRRRVQGGRVAALAAVAAGVAIHASDARAADRVPGARWLAQVESTAPACAADRAAFEREIALACGAVGGTCHVVDSPRDAELKATLRCTHPDRPWTLELATVEGIVVSTSELAGPPDDRLREAAMEVARDQAPERLLAADSLRDTLGDGDRPTRRRLELPRASLALGATAAAGAETTTGGARALGGLLLGGATHATLGVTGIMGGSGLITERHARSGLGLAWGAPFDRSIIGLAVAGGVDLGEWRGPAFGAGATRVTNAVSGYGETTLFLQIPLDHIRPYAGMSLLVLAAEHTTAYASADLGVAFPLF